jgi:hypothetical protein
MKEVDKDPFSNGSEHRAFEAYCCGKWTWKRNPYVFAYTFELVK